ncbi:hypothetical protein D9757_013598 [Collybiopsis confluens]|uniref:Retrotransposon gag domain-containing protein n=1 Tax=Collybiopsis confluens TaxID=2823264 RepID=A0A8H5GKL9_9AGAR|nr:hypothetical protein D9757_013598 [Collybiopsis confluens]
MDSYYVAWIYGLAGSGKSAVAVSLAERLRKMDSQVTLALTFHCVKGQETSNTFQLVPTICYHLAQCVPQYAKALVDIFEKDASLHAGSIPIREQLSRFLQPLYKMDQNQYATSTYIIIDGLDEWGKPADQYIFLENLQSHLQKIGRIYIVVTSRQERDIARAMNNSSIVQSFNLTASYPAHQDIAKFFEMHFGIKTAHKISGHDIDALTKKAGNLFLWANTAVNYLEMQYSLKMGVETLLNTKEQTARDIIENPYSELYDLYAACRDNRTVDSSLVPYLDLLVVPAESLTITPSYSAHVSDSEEPEFDCTDLAHAWDTVDKTYVHRRVADTPSAWFDCHNQPCPNATESHSIQTERRTGRSRRLLIPLSQIETFEQNPSTSSLPITAPPPRFGRTSNPTSSRASPALIAPFPRRPVDTDVVISAVGQALIPTRAESVPEPIRVDTPPNPSIQPDPEMAQITGQDVLRAINDLAANQAALQQVVTDVVTSMNNNKGVSKPHNYNGVGSEDARRFLAAFEVWAQGVPNLRSLTGNEPVKSAISFLEGDAAIWATPIAENISAHTSNNNVPLTYPDWADFRAAFTARFETADPVTDAKNMLKALYQGKNSVAAYAATFKQYSERTGYSDTDLRDKFYEHLTDRVKDGLVHSQANTSLLANLITEATRIDNRINERFRQKTPFKAVTPATHHFQPINAPFVAHRDPNAMDVDATRTVTNKSSDDYRRFMTGRCYGCGSKNHRKADGHHERDV